MKPTVRGLTEIGRDGGHVLVAMGFREVDNVVANAVFQGSGRKSRIRAGISCAGVVCDYRVGGRYGFEGVKENLMIGKAVSVGRALPH